MLSRLLSKDFLSGMMFIVFGLVALWFGRHLAMGTTVRMGPGYVPHMLAYIMMGLGGIISVLALVKQGELPEVPSLNSLWRTADWHEREVYDLGGVWFTGHPDLTRILLADDWVGHPLRKDYEFPLEYHGIRGR